MADSPGATAITDQSKAAVRDRRAEERAMVKHEAELTALRYRTLVEEGFEPDAALLLTRDWHGGNFCGDVRVDGEDG